jgi:hypothetical protein
MQLNSLASVHSAVGAADPGPATRQVAPPPVCSTCLAARPTVATLLLHAQRVVAIRCCRVAFVAMEVLSHAMKRACSPTGVALDASLNYVGADEIACVLCLKPLLTPVPMLMLRPAVRGATVPLQRRLCRSRTHRADRFQEAHRFVHGVAPVAPPPSTSSDHSMWSNAGSRSHRSRTIFQLTVHRSQPQAYRSDPTLV